MKDLLTKVEIAKELGISKSIINHRINALFLKPISSSYFNPKQVDKIKNYNYRDELIPEIIYVHTTWTILESKLNFLK